MTADLSVLRAMAEGTAPVRDVSAIPLSLGGEEFWVDPEEILFFASDGEKTTAITEQRLFYCDKKLYELADLLPSFFRVSKSHIANLRAVRSLRKEITGICEVKLGKEGKTVFVSRMYYKPFRERLMELHHVR